MFLLLFGIKKINKNVLKRVSLSVKKQQYMLHNNSAIELCMP